MKLKLFFILSTFCSLVLTSPIKPSQSQYNSELSESSVKQITSEYAKELNAGNTDQLKPTKQNEQQLAQTINEPREQLETKEPELEENKKELNEKNFCKFNLATETCSSTDNSFSIVSPACSLEVSTNKCLTKKCYYNGSTCVSDVNIHFVDMYSSRLCHLDIKTGACNLLKCGYDTETRECLKVFSERKQSIMVIPYAESYDQVCNYDAFFDKCILATCVLNTVSRKCEFFGGYAVQGITYLVKSDWCLFVPSKGSCKQLN